MLLPPIPGTNQSYVIYQDATRFTNLGGNVILRSIVACFFFLFSSMVGAQVTDIVPVCLPNNTAITGQTGSHIWATWQCHPYDLTVRYWQRCTAIVDLDTFPTQFTPIIDGGKARDSSVIAAAAAMRTNNLSDPIFAATMAQIKAAQDTQPSIASYIEATTGETCACDVANALINDVLWCPLARNIGPDLRVCRHH